MEISQRIDHAPTKLREGATDVAKEHHYLYMASPVAYPTTLEAGDLQLRMGDALFDLYIRSSNHHMDVRLQSRELEVSKQAKRETKAFIQDVIDRLAIDCG